MADTFVIPGTTGPTISVERRSILRPRVTVDGVVLPNLRSPFALRYEVPMADGADVEFELKGRYRGFRAVLGSVQIPLERPLRTVELAAIYLPFVVGIAATLVVDRVGHATGTLGWAFPVVAAMLTYLSIAAGTSLMHRPARPIIKVGGVVAMCLITGVFGWISQRQTLGYPSFSAGQCLNVGSGGTLFETTPTVDCAAPHVSEVIGVVPLDPAAAFPGVDALKGTGSAQCQSIFAAYVGSDPAGSSLVKAFFQPSATGWSRGDHKITCFVYARDGTELVGSVGHPATA